MRINYSNLRYFANKKYYNSLYTKWYNANRYKIFYTIWYNECTAIHL